MEPPDPLLGAPEAEAFRSHLRLFDPVHLPLLVTDTDGIVRYADPAACRLLGLAADARGRPISRLVPVLARESPATNVRAEAGLLRLHPLRLAAAPAGLWRLVLVQPVADAEAPALPIQVRQLALLRLATRGVGHDVNNHLASVLLSCGLLGTGPGVDRGLVETAEASAQGALRLLGELHNLARRGDDDTRPSSLRETPGILIDGLRKLHELGLGRRLPVEVDVIAAEPLSADAVELAILLTGLWRSCLESPPPGARMRVLSRKEAGGVVVLRFEIVTADAPPTGPILWEPGFWESDGERRLALCDGLARAAGGELRRAAAGTGSAVELVLPPPPS